MPEGSPTLTLEPRLQPLGGVLTRWMESAAAFFEKHGVGLLLTGIVVFAVGAPMVGPGPTLLHPDAVTLPPGHPEFWLGTDDLGRDLMSRLAIGARISLVLGLLTACLSAVIGGAYGLLAGLREGWLDTVLMRAVDVLYSLPGLMVIILFSVFLEPMILSLQPVFPWIITGGIPRLLSIVLALSFFSWPDTARMIRSQVLQLKREQYIEAFRAQGGGSGRLILSHLLPNLWGLLLLNITIIVPRAILTESTLSFIGLGVEAPMSSWGTLAAEGWQLVRIAPHLLILPSLAIVLTMMLLNQLGEQLKQRLQ